MSPGRSFPEIPLAESAFPLLNWFVFVAFGLAFGKLLRRCRDLDRLFAVSTPPALALYVGCTIWGAGGSPLVHIHDSESAFYYLSIFDVLLVGIPAVMLMLGAGHFAGKVIRGGAAELIRHTSTDLNRIYLIHWPIVMWIVDVLLHRTFGLEMSSIALLFVSFAVLAASVFLARRDPFRRFKL